MAFQAPALSAMAAARSEIWQFSSLTALRPALHRPLALDCRATLAALPRGTLAAANSGMRRAWNPSMIRQMSTAPTARPSALSNTSFSPFKPQQRTFLSGNVSRNLLAHLEETANKNTNSATAQHAFYQALLRANMPAIVVERYQSNQFASNSACEAAYQKALSSLGQSTGGLGNVNNSSHQSAGLNNQQIQAIGQAIAAQNQGGNIGISRAQNQNQGTTGAKDAPLYVVVDETIGNIIFKWVKFFLYFGLLAYGSLAVLTLVADGFSTFKKVGGKQDNEVKPEQQTTRFSDVHGCDEAMEELQELVDFLKNPAKFSTLGGKLPKGVLLVGPPGTGKTLLARAVAGEAGVPFFYMSGSEFDEVYVGVGAKRVRELFAVAKSKSPAIIFIDELDAIGGKRNAKDAAYVKQTLNQLLTELDGFEQNSGVIILGATNFPEMLDKALTRPGRFDRNVVVPLPDVRGRLAILQHHVKKIKLGPDAQLEPLAAGTPGFSGAELENVVNQAAIYASKHKKNNVSMNDLEWAKDKVMMGAEKKNMIMTEDTKLMTAYHEAGHAIVGMYTPGADPLHKVTILPRGLALGLTWHLPAMDRHSMSLKQYLASMDISMGGKVAEQLVYGDDEVTSGASSDLQNVTNVAYNLVTRFGMSPRLGNVDLASNHGSLSSETRQAIEDEVRRLTEEARSRAMILLTEKRVELDRLAKALVDYETLDREEALKVVKGEKLEGREVMSKGNIKIPGSTPVIGGAGGVGLPPTPGSEPPEPAPAPPTGGVVGSPRVD